MIRVFIANSNSIILEGLSVMIDAIDGVEVVGSASCAKSMFEKIEHQKVDVLMIDYTSELFDLMELKKLLIDFKSIEVIGITDFSNRHLCESALNLGLKGHILNCCDKQELKDSILALSEGQQFYCEKVLQTTEEDALKSCKGIRLSKREIEIIGLIAEGLKTQEISQQLFLSVHTVNTHRKNIMNKLGIANTAGLVMFAVKQKIVQPNKFLFAN